MISLLAAAFLLFLGAQATAERPSFEVASIKKSTQVYSTLQTSGDRFFGKGWTLRDLMQFAYAPCDDFLLDSQVVGGPPWVGSDHFDIEARAGGDGATVSRCQLNLMVQSLLATRFQLKAHFETRELPIYQMVVVKPGKMKASEDQTPPVLGTFTPNPSKPLPRGIYTIRSGPSGPSSTIISGTAMSIERVMKSLQNASPEFRNRLIVDKTGLSGLFDINLQFAAAPSAGQPATDAPYPALYTAIQEQLGLKLESARGPVQVLVVESVEKPSEN